MIRSRPTIVVIQSRLASTRLPAKALLPMAGRATVALCALRAANSGLHVIVATSDAPTDDAIVDVLTSAGVRCFRGSHADVLSRFAQATREFADSDLVVRLTADNLFPDGAFVDAVVEEFERCGGDYIGTDFPQGGMPYGMSAEAFTIAALRRAEREAVELYDREHVTPWIRRACIRRRYVHRGGYACWSRLRCTLDTFEDYEVLLQVFAGVQDPVNIRWQELVSRLASLSLGGSEPRCPFRERPDGSTQSVLTLGTAQLGSSYGIANSAGMPNDGEAKAMLARAADAGITSIDTASVYGESEVRIGKFLPRNFVDQIQITTKLSVLADVPLDATVTAVANATDASVFKSLHRLGRRYIDTLLLHRWSHHNAWSGAAWQRLLELKRTGLIRTLGASVSNPGEAIEALSDPDVGQLQCPVNILDGRWRDATFLAKAATRPDVVIHARSVLLQGLLTLPASRWIQAGGVDAWQLCATLDELVRLLGRRDRVDLCMSYVAAVPWVGSLVVGMESVEQLKVNLGRVQAPILSPSEMAVVSERIPVLPESLLNPALWRT
jgi:spore coat polysaccharide biosynthesis protein SpsF (cytidylyltransferase family)/aryl-alcohol dehydrogenase-like predicted oxidoreductase